MDLETCRLNSFYAVMKIYLV